jgi:hypothetical protein
MPRIFTATAGMVMAIDTNTDGGAVGLPLTIAIDSDQGNDAGTTSVDQLGGIITSFTATGETNTQFMHTLRDVIYLTVFGDKIGSLSIGGYLFLNTPLTCGPAGSGGGSAPLSDFYSFFYNKYVGFRKEPLQIAIGREMLKGFLLSFQIQVADPQFMLGQFTMQMALLPGKN